MSVLNNTISLTAENKLDEDVSEVLETDFLSFRTE